MFVANENNSNLSYPNMKSELIILSLYFSFCLEN